MLSQKTWPNFQGFSKFTAKDALTVILSEHNFTADKEYLYSH